MFFRQTLKQWHEYLMSLTRPRHQPGTHRAVSARRLEMYRGQHEHNGRVEEVQAYTRSEARAKLKARFGIKGRLPVGVRVDRVADQAAA